MPKPVTKPPKFRKKVAGSGSKNDRKEKKVSPSPRREGNTTTQRAFFVVVALVACAIACGVYLKTALGDPYSPPNIPLRPINANADPKSAAAILALIEAPGELSPQYREAKPNKIPIVFEKQQEELPKQESEVAEAIKSVRETSTINKQKDEKGLKDKVNVDSMIMVTPEQQPDIVHEVQDTTAPIPTGAPPTGTPPVYRSPEIYLPRVVEELRAFYTARDLPDKAEQAQTMVKRIENNPKKLYSSLRKRYGEVRQEFPSLIEWAGIPPPSTSIPDTEIPETNVPEIPETVVPDTAEPASETGRLTVGDKVILSPSASGRVKRDGAIKGTDIGTIIEDQMDNQPYRIRGPTGKVYWYKESDVLPAGASASEDKNGDKNPIPAGRGSGGGRSRGGGRGTAHVAQVTYLDVGYHVTAAHDFKVGDSVVVQQGSPGIVSEVKSETKYKVRFLGEFGLNSPVILTVGITDVVLLRTD